VSEFDRAAFAAFEAEGWTTKEAAAYDALAGRVTSRLAGPILDAVGAGARTRLLDVATGPGHVAAQSVRVRPMILGQTEELQREIRRRYDELLEPYRANDGFSVPVSVTLASGTKT
jgi:hypothetical protein